MRSYFESHRKWAGSQYKHSLRKCTENSGKQIFSTNVTVSKAPSFDKKTFPAPGTQPDSPNCQFEFRKPGK